MARFPWSRHAHDVRRWLALVLVALLVAACGGADPADGDPEPGDSAGPDDGDSGADGETAGDATGVTDDSITLGTFGDVSGPVAAVGQPMRTAREIVAQKVNDGGGIHGRTIELVHEDDQYDPGRTVGAVRKLIESDEVFLIFDSIGTPQCEAVMDYLRDNGVPVIQCGVSTRDESITWAWQTVPTGHTGALAMARYAVEELGAVSIGIVAQEGEVGQPFIDGVADGLAGSEVEVIETVTYKATDTDLSSQVSRLRAAEPDLVLVNGNPRSSSLFYNEAQKAGFTPPKGFFADISQYDAVLLSLVDPAFLEGLLIAGYIESLDRDVPSIEQFKADVERYAPDAEPSSFMLLGYADALVTMEVLRRAGPDLTRERVHEVLAKEMEGYDAEGLLVPLQWSGDRRAGVQGISINRVEGGRFVRMVDYYEGRR